MEAKSTSADRTCWLGESSSHEVLPGDHHRTVRRLHSGSDCELRFDATEFSRRSARNAVFKTVSGLGNRSELGELLAVLLLAGGAVGSGGDQRVLASL
jgi:hypothetical protein